MSGQPPETAPALVYARALHTELLTANRDLYSRAQTVLTLDALVVTVFGAIVSGSPEDARTTAARIGPVAGVLGIVALAAIAISIMCALVALYVRHLSGRSVATDGPPAGSQLSFYGRIAEVDPDAFVEAASGLTQTSETEVRLRQVAVMAPIMTRRANWVNASFLAAGTGFIAFVMTIVVYLLRLAG